MGLLYLLCYLSMRAQRAPSIVLVLVWILRTAIMNSTKPLTRSVIMDSAPRVCQPLLGSLSLYDKDLRPGVLPPLRALGMPKIHASVKLVD